MDKNELKKIENFYKIIEILRRKLLDRNDISKNSDKINYILFNYSNLFFKNKKITSKEFIKILKEKIDFKEEDIDIFQVKNDSWYLISLN